MSDTDRKLRSEEGREIEERNNMIMKRLTMEYKGPLYFPPELIPDGMEYRLVRMSLFGDPSFSRVAEMFLDGWTFVPPSRHPHFGMRDPLDKSGPKDHIEIKGNVLMERPKHFGDLQRKLDMEYQMRLLNENPANTTMMQDRNVPISYQRHVTNLRTFSQ